MTVFDSRPDPLYIRTGGREGYPMGGPDAELKREERRNRTRPTRATSREDDEERPTKDPRYAWLPW